LKNALSAMAMFAILGFAAQGLRAAPVSSPADGRCQSMSGAYQGVQYCQAPLYALLANSTSYDQGHVATFGYLLKEGGRTAILSPVADALRRIDFLDCVGVDLSGARFEEDSSSLEDGIYFVMVQGRFKHGAVNGACVGSFSNAYISRISKVSEEPHDAAVGAVGAGDRVDCESGRRSALVTRTESLVIYREPFIVPRGPVGPIQDDGCASVRFQIDGRGQPVNVGVGQTSGSRTVDVAARETLKKYRFEVPRGSVDTVFELVFPDVPRLCGERLPC